VEVNQDPCYKEAHTYEDLLYKITICIALRYGLDDQGSGVRLPAAAGNYSLHHRVQNGSGAHPTSYPVGTRGSFPGGYAAGA